MNHDHLYCLRHSLSHVLAQAIQRTIDPRVQLGTGPAIDDGFYYDVMFSSQATSKTKQTDGTFVFDEAELKELGKAVEGIVKEGQKFGRYTAQSKSEALELCKLMGQEFKQELIEKFYEADNNAVYTFYYNTVDAKILPMLEKKSHSEYISLYKTLTAKIAELDPTFDSAYLISFLDLCEGGHVETLKDIPDGCFAMNKIAGAYRQGKEGNPMMTRIYGWAFDTKDALKAHLAMLEEAKKRDHRII